MMLPLIENPPPWPDGARCAVCLSFDFDAESLLHLYHPQDAARQVHLAAALRYGAEIAVPRLVKIFNRFGLTQTVFAPGWCVETYPDAIRMLVDNGHEIAHHGWLHERPNACTREQERTILLRGADAIEAATGQRPKGYRAPSNAFSDNSFDLLVEAGFVYDASLGGDDVPYLLEGATGRLIEIPQDVTADDWPQYAHIASAGYMMPLRAPARAMEVFAAEFDAAWRHGGLWTAVWHPFLSGRPARAEAMMDLIAHMIDRGGVWFATMAQIAAHVEGLIAAGAWQPRVTRMPMVSALPERLAAQT